MGTYSDAVALRRDIHNKTGKLVQYWQCGTRTYERIRAELGEQLEHEYDMGSQQMRYMLLGKVIEKVIGMPEGELRAFANGKQIGKLKVREDA